MLFDWFTVGAQALNFLILVYLMRRFLYKPILHAIDERERRIAAELASADEKMAEAQKEREEYRHKSDDFDERHAALLSQATAEAGVERQRLLDEARQAADALGAKRRERLRSDARNLNEAISNRTQHEVFAIVRKALMDLAGASLEERLVDVFTRRLRGLDSQANAMLAKALAAATEPVLVRTAFHLAADQRSTVQNAVNETFSADIPLRFEAAPSLVGGIELATNGLKIGWSIDEYLKSLQEGVWALLKEKDTPAGTREREAGAGVDPQSEETIPEAGRP